MSWNNISIYIVQNQNEVLLFWLFPKNPPCRVQLDEEAKKLPQTLYLNPEIDNRSRGRTQTRQRIHFALGGVTQFLKS